MSAAGGRRPVGVAVAGSGWMGRVHAQAAVSITAPNFLRSIAEGTPHGTTLADAVRSAATLDAMARSAETGTWVEVADT